MQSHQSYVLRRTDLGLWVGARPGSAGDCDLRFDEDLGARFDLEDRARVTLLVVDLESVDELLLAALVGFDATAELLSGADRIEATVTDTARRSAHVARLAALCEVPVLRTHRAEWRSGAAVLTASLVDSGFPMEDIVVAHLEALASELEGSGTAARQRAAANPAIARGVRLGVEMLDPAGPSWRLLRSLAQDLPEPGDRTVEEMLSSMPAYRGATDAEDALPGFKGGDTADIELPAFRGGPIARSGPAPRRQPLVWALIDEDLLPEDDAFDGAVTIVQEAGEAAIRVASPPEDAPALWVRLLDANNEPASVAALLPGPVEWSGVVPLPEDFGADTHRIEVVDDLSRPVVVDVDAAIESQWAMLSVARDAALEPVDLDTD